MKMGMQWMAVVAVLGLLGSAPALAGDKKAGREREMLRRVQQQLQQVQGQAATLEEEKARLSGDLEKAAREGEAARGRAARLAREQKQDKEKLARLEADMAALNQRLAETDQRLAEASKGLAETTQTLRQTEAEKRGLEGIRQLREREIALCEDKNGKLYQLGRELMVRYEQKGLGDALLQQDPLTGLKQVGIENLLEEYRDKLDEQQILKAPGS